MPIFALKLSEFAKGIVKIFNLVVDEIDQFETFENSLEDKYLSEFRSFAATIYQISENKKPPPRGKRRKIEGVSGVTEMRSRNLRLYYLIIKEEGIIICLGGYKKTQKKDIKRLINLRALILKYIKENGRLNIKP